MVPMLLTACQPQAKDFPELPWLFSTSNDRTGAPDARRFRFTGEDFVFCDAYIKKYQDPIPVWPDFEFSHAGYKCNFYKYLQRVAGGEEVPERDDSTRINGELTVPKFVEEEVKGMNDKARDNSGVMVTGRTGKPDEQAA
jgi:hypothetical protein